MESIQVYQKRLLLAHRILLECSLVRSDTWDTPRSEAICFASSLSERAKSARGEFGKWLLVFEFKSVLTGNPFKKS